MAKPIKIHNTEELQKYKTTIKNNLERCISQLNVILKENDMLAIFQSLEMVKCVTEPLSGKPENLIEVINQSMTYMVSIMACEYLYEQFPEQIFCNNWGNVTGYDIESVDGTIIGECFAATSYASNGKLKKDLDRLKENTMALHKYEFFFDKKFNEKQRIYYEKRYPEIESVKFNEMDMGSKWEK